MKIQAIALAFCTLLPVSAATITFSDRATFLAAVSSPQDFDFQVPAAPAAITDVGGGQVALSTPGGASAVSLQVYGTTQAIGGRTSLGELNNFLSILLTFSPNITAVGFDNLDLTGGTSEFAIVTINFSDGSPSETYNFTTPTPLTPQFFGVTTTSPIASLSVYSANTPTDQPGGRANLIDNLVIANAGPDTGVPEPGTALTASLGILLVAGGAFARRK